MKNRGMYRGIEDPIQGMFNLADEISSRSEGILFRSVFASIFAYFGLLVMGLLLIVFLIQGNVCLSLVFLSVLVTGVVTIGLLRNLREFLRKVTFRYSALMAMREGTPIHNIPEGRDPSERFMNYLRSENPAFKKLVKDRPEHVHKDAHLVGKSGKRHHFNIHVRIPPSIRYRLFGSGYGGYSLYIKEYTRVPTVNDIESLVQDLQDVTRVSRVRPRRVVMLFKASKEYAGLSDDAYDMLIQGIQMPGKGKETLNLQAVAEVAGQHYDFVPFIPEMRNMLP